MRSHRPMPASTDVTGAPPPASAESAPPGAPPARRPPAVDSPADAAAQAAKEGAPPAVTDEEQDPEFALIKRFLVGAQREDDPLRTLLGLHIYKMWRFSQQLSREVFEIASEEGGILEVLRTEPLAASTLLQFERQAERYVQLYMKLRPPSAAKPQPPKSSSPPLSDWGRLGP